MATGIAPPMAALPPAIPGGGMPLGAMPPAAPAMPGAANPLAALAGRGAPGGGLPDSQMKLLMFLAGMGFPEFAKSMNSMKPKEPKAGHGLPADAARAPGQAMIPPQLLQAALSRGGMPGAGASPLAGLMPK